MRSFFQPARDGRIATQETQAVRSAAPAVITIALADHHRLIRESVRFLLETENDVKVVGEVADGLKVVGLVERRKPRVLIMALVMPGFNSFEVIRRVRQRSPETAVILLSMHAGDQYVVEALRSGASGYVGTQAKGIELIRAVREVAAGGRYLSAPLSEHRMDTWLQRAKSRALDPYDALTRREREVFNLVSEATAAPTSRVVCPSAVARQNRTGRTSCASCSSAIGSTSSGSRLRAVSWRCRRTR